MHETAYLKADPPTPTCTHTTESKETKNKNSRMLGKRPKVENFPSEECKQNRLTPAKLESKQRIQNAFQTITDDKVFTILLVTLCIFSYIRRTLDYIRCQSVSPNVNTRDLELHTVIYGLHCCSKFLYVVRFFN